MRANSNIFTPMLKGLPLLIRFGSIFVALAMLLPMNDLIRGATLDSLKPEWIVDSGVVDLVGGVTAEEAQQEALSRAVYNASARLGEALLQSQFSLIMSDESSESNRHQSSVRYYYNTAKGRPRDIKKIDVHASNLTSNGIFLQRMVVICSVLVVPDTLNPDPSFMLSIEPNHDVYREYEKIEYGIYATQDCYFNLFAVDEDGAWVLIFPDETSTDNAVKANTWVTIPPKEAGWSITARLSSVKRERQRELVVGVATKDPRPIIFPSNTESRMGFRQLPNGFVDFVRWLGQIPRDRQTQVQLVLGIERE